MSVVIHDFIHPEDAAAREQLENVPGFAAALKLFLRAGAEQYLHGTNMAEKIRLGPNQLPDLHARLRRPCAVLGIPEPEFYLEMSPAPNAYTFGYTRTFLTVTSGLLEYLDEDEVDAVIAHECGHIACRHVLYHTMGRVIAQGADILGVLGSLSLPVQFGLQYWSRRSELSADRAAALVMGSASPVVETMIRLAGGPKKLTAAVDAEAYAAQADAYDTLQRDSTWDKVLQGVATANLSHPFPAVRTREILRWSRTEHFSRLRAALGHDAGDRNTHQPACVRCGANIEATWRFCQSCGASLPS